jgi:hypothetical protein
MAIAETPITHTTIDWKAWNKIAKKRKPWKENACRDTKTLTRQRKQLSDIEMQESMEIGLKMSQKYLWCHSHRGHLLCTKSIKTKIGRSNLPGFLILPAKMFQLMRGTDPQDKFSLNPKLKELFFLREPNWPHWLRISILGYCGTWFNPSLVN